MTADWTTIGAFALLLVVSLMLFFALRQALGERGRAGVARFIDFFVKPKSKEVPDATDAP